VFHLGNGASGVAGGSLPSTETQPAGTTVEYRVTIDRASGGKQISNTATASYDNRLGDRPEPLTSTSNEQITQVKPAADLTVTKAADATTVTVGQTVTYRITVHNTGPNGATGVTVTDRLPDTLTFLSADGTPGRYDPATGQWTVGDLADGDTATLVLRAKATKAGLISNTATATSNEKDPDTTNNTDTVSVCVEPAPLLLRPLRRLGRFGWKSMKAVPVEDQWHARRRVRFLEGDDPAHHQEMVAEHSGLPQSAVDPEHGSLQQRVAEDGAGPAYSGEFVPSGAGEPGAQTLLTGRQDVDREAARPRHVRPAGGGGGHEEAHQRRLQ
jgi:uncharacterized repeat protein (TIGR01451 family)